MNNRALSLVKSRVAAPATWYMRDRAIMLGEQRVEHVAARRRTKDKLHIFVQPLTRVLQVFRPLPFGNEPFAKPCHTKPPAASRPVVLWLNIVLPRIVST